MNRRGSQQCPVSHPELRPNNLAAHHLQLVPKHEQLNVFHVQAAPATNERTQHGTDREAEEGDAWLVRTIRARSADRGSAF